MNSRKNIILIVASISVFFEALDIAIVNLAMPMIQEDFSLTSDTLQWLQTLYVLLYGGLLIVGGKLADVLGRKKIFMVGSFLFLATSLGAGLAPSFGWLLGFRALQGLAAALLMPAALSIITTTFTDPRERGKAIGIFSAFAAIGSGSGLSIGGLIATYLGWQWMFFINVPIILISLLVGAIYIEKDQKEQKPMPDILSGILLTLVIVALSYITHEAVHLSQNLYIALPFVIFIGAGSWLFLKRSSQLQHPLIKFQALKSSVTGIVGFLLLGAVFTSYLFVISLILQENMSFTAAQAGLLLFPFSILSALVGKFLMPWLMKKFTVLEASIMGMGSMLLGSALLFICSLMEYNVWMAIISVACISGFGIAICFTAMMVMCVQGVPEEHHGLASSVGSTAYFLGSGLGLSILSIFMYNGLRPGVGTLPIVIIGLYALIGVVLLFMRRRFYIRRSLGLSSAQGNEM